ncbi:MAG: cell division protein FtsJ [Methanosarcinaceae archaeon]|nr:cell division protein FtsJ [Methanosarcinaceae archaeon]NKQ38508.1 cell division protein FtsJ [Methanosarcinales archaeon]
MRLDKYLIESGHFKSRARAKSAILEGFVQLNKVVVKKPSMHISEDGIVEVKERQDVPFGYFKLKEIQEKTGIIKESDSVLDLGSSAGGFLLFASLIAKSVKGIEYSKEFKEELEEIAQTNDNVSVIFGDVFKIPRFIKSSTMFDVILSDMTLEPANSLIALEIVLPHLKMNGKLLQVIKIRTNKRFNPIIKQMESLGLKIIDLIKSEKEEIYILAEKIKNNSHER